MRKFTSSLLTFATGAAVAVLVVALLTVSGILPVKTTVTGQSSSSGATTTQAALTTGTLTAEQIYKQDSAGVVEVLSTFAQSASPRGAVDVRPVGLTIRPIVLFDVPGARVRLRRL